MLDLNNPMLKPLLKQFLPKAVEVAKEKEIEFCDFIAEKEKSLEEGETHVSAVTQVSTETKEVFVIIAAFKGMAFSRALDKYSVREWIEKYSGTILNVPIHLEEMQIDFCECGGMLVPDGDKVKCRTCGKLSDKKVDAKITTKQEKKETLVFENNEPDLPKTEKVCEKCGHREAYYWLIQTRSSDEPPTQFFRCTKCRYVWREYK